MEGKPRSITSTAIIITLISALSKALGFMREAVIASVFGVGVVTDAYAVAARVVGTAGLLVFIYLNQIFIPTYVRAFDEGGEEGALKAANSSLWISMIGNFALMGVLYVAAPLIVGLTNFNSEEASLALTSVNIMLLQLPLMVYVNLFTGYLAARKGFVGANIIGIPINIVIVVSCIIFGTRSGVVGLSVATVLGTLAQVVTAVIWLRREKFRHTFSVKLNTPEIRKDMVLLLPALLGATIFEMKSWVDTIIATYLGEGNTAAIGFALRLVTLVQGLVVLPIATMIYSYLSDYAAKNDIQGMLDILWKAVRVILFFVLPMSVIAVPHSFDIVQIVFERGEFTPDATVMTGMALMFYVPGLLGMAVYAFLVRFFYGLKDTKTPMVSGAVAVGVNIALSIWLANVMGIRGLALATTIGNAMSALLLLVLLRRKLGPLGFFGTALDFIKMVISAIPCVLAVFGIRYLLAGQGAILRFGASTVVGGVAYLLTAFVLKEMVLREGIQLLKGRFVKGSVSSE